MIVALRDDSSIHRESIMRLKTSLIAISALAVVCALSVLSVLPRCAGFAPNRASRRRNAPARRA